MRELKVLPRGHGGATHILYTYTDTGVDTQRLQLNKIEARRLQGAIDAEQAVAAPSTPGAPARRSIVLARNAAGLNTGRQWIADGWLVDKYSLPPEWEGESVCYLYDN